MINDRVFKTNYYNNYMVKFKSNFFILLKRLWSHINNRRKLQIGGLILLIVITSFAEVFSIGAVLPFLGVLSSPDIIFQNNYIKPIVFFFKIKKSEDLLMPITFIFIVTIIISGILRMILLWAQTRISFSIGSDISFKVYRNTLFQPYEIHLSRNSSEVISGIMTKSAIVINHIIMPTITIISSLIMLLIVLAAILTINPTVAITSILTISIIYFIIIMITKKRLSTYGQIINIESNKLIKALQEGLGGIREVLIDGTQDTYCEVYRKADLPTKRSQANIVIIGGIPRFAIEAFGMIFIALIAYRLAKVSLNFSVAIPVLGSLALGAQRLFPILQQLFVSWSNLIGGQSSLNDMLELLDQEPIENLNTNDNRIITFNNSISLNNISFRYSPESPWVLKDINLNFKRGSKVGIIGTTGGGKSTLLDLIINLLQPTDGAIYIDEQKLTSSNSRSWQSHISHVPQSIFLSDASISENIAFGITPNEIDHEQVRYAAKKAQIADVIETWEKKYKTKVGERGVRLSGGQRQRIGIARALYKKSDVIIFDEATSALDNQTESEVMKSINDLGNDLTIIIVAHRISTLNNCDIIFELVNGKVLIHKK